MAEEPQPTEVPPQPTVAEQKQEAAALSNLSTHGDENEKRASSSADSAALGAALSSLSVSGPGASEAGKVAGQEKQKAETKKVKVDAADVNFLVEELELSKKKATEMLQANGGDRMSAVRAFVVPAIKT